MNYIIEDLYYKSIVEYSTLLQKEKVENLELKEKIRILEEKLDKLENNNKINYKEMFEEESRNNRKYYKFISNIEKEVLKYLMNEINEIDFFNNIFDLVCIISQVKVYSRYFRNIKENDFWISKKEDNCTTKKEDNCTKR